MISRRLLTQRTWIASARLVALVVVCAGALGIDSAQAISFGRRFHQWGRFRPGSWVVVRQGCETLDAAGKVVEATTSELRTTLANVDDKALTLHVQASLEVGGKTLDGARQQLHEGLFGERPEAAHYQDIGEADVTIQGRHYRCQVQQVEVDRDGRRQITKTWFAPHVAPFVLRKQTTIIDVANGQTLSDTTMEVVSLANERRILARARSLAEVRIVERHPRGETKSRAFSSPDIPGGIVSQTTEEFDSTGKLLRRTQMELVDFETK